MDITVTGRQMTISDRFRDHIEEKLIKVEQLAPKAQRVEVHVTHEKNARQPETGERVELTVVAKGPVIRAEATASDKYGALDLAYGKLLERLRRSRDKQKVSRQGKHRKPSTAEALADVAALDTADDTAAPQDYAADEHVEGLAHIDAEGDSPVVVREKNFPAAPIDLDEALSRMELVGHDFYLYIDKSTAKPSVVYRRKGWSYGVISLDSALNDESNEDAQNGSAQ